MLLAVTNCHFSRTNGKLTLLLLYDKRNCIRPEVYEELNQSKSIYVQVRDTLKGLVTTMNDQCVYGNGEMLSAEESPAKQKLKGWLNRSLKIKMTDGRVLIGAFLCTDRDANVILGTCSEFLSEEHTEPRVLGSVMVPGRHIVSIHLDA